MAKEIIKMCDMPLKVAVTVFYMLNPGKITVEYDYRGFLKMETKEPPSSLIYPEGWYYRIGFFSNKGRSSTGAYWDVGMYKPNGELWGWDD